MSRDNFNGLYYHHNRHLAHSLYRDMYENKWFKRNINVVMWAQTRMWYVCGFVSCFMPLFNSFDYIQAHRKFNKCSKFESFLMVQRFSKKVYCHGCLSIIWSDTNMTLCNPFNTFWSRTQHWFCNLHSSKDQGHVTDIAIVVTYEKILWN